MSAPRIAFVTFGELPLGPDDDAIAFSVLREHGAVVEWAVWNDPAIAWEDFHLIVLRSTWDYHDRSAEFREWLERLQSLGAPVWNPISTVLWNMDKRYLLELAARKVPVIATRRIERGSDASLEKVLAEEGWADVVVKPAISASGYRTFRASLAEASQSADAFRALVAESDVLVQPFVQEIQREGEWSLLFFGGVFSHAALKRPKGDDFRTQAGYGGSHARTEPNESLVRQAEAALAAAGAETLYARVDGIVVRDRFQLMELELIEPSFYFDGDRAAAERFARAVMTSIRGAAPS